MMLCYTGWSRQFCELRGVVGVGEQGEAMTRSRDASETLLAELDPVLEGLEFVVGARFTAADVALASYILYLPMQHPEVTFPASTVCGPCMS